MQRQTRGGLWLLGWMIFSIPAIAEEPIEWKADFEDSSVKWTSTDPAKWTVDREPNGNHVYHLHGRSDYTPLYRSPHSISLAEGIVGDFTMTMRVKTLQTPRPHRDLCIFFGYQDPAHFYYVHLGQRTDPHANQIFIVDAAPRVKISTKTNDGTPWKDDHWHQVKIVRDVSEGTIEVYFDDMETPQMTAKDKRFQWGKVGVGSFDDMGLFDDIELKGTAVDPPAGANADDE